MKLKTKDYERKENNNISLIAQISKKKRVRMQEYYLERITNIRYKVRKNKQKR